MKKLIAMLLALAMVLSMMTVAVFAEGTEDLPDDDDAGNLDAGDTTPEPAPEQTPEQNPVTGISLMVLPMVAAAAAAVASKKH